MNNFLFPTVLCRVNIKLNLFMYQGAGVIKTHIHKAADKEIV